MKNSKSNPIRKSMPSNGARRVIAIIMYIVSFAILSVVISFLAEPIELKSYDSRMQAKSKLSIADTSDIVIVGIDDETFRQLKKWYVPRGYYADILAYLEKTPARVIGVDVDFNFDLKNMTAEDKKLYKVLSSAKKMVLAKSLSELQNLKTSLNYGFIDIPQDKDGVIRKYLFFYPGKEKLFSDDIPGIFYSFAYKIPIFNVFYDKSTTVSSPYLCPLESNYKNPSNLSFYINYPGPPGTVKVISACFAKNAPPEFFKNKIVLVGNTSYAQGKDYYHTPFFKKGYVDTLMCGVEIHAGAVYTLLNGDFITRTDGLPGISIVLLWSLLIFLLILWLSFWAEIIITILATIIYTIFAYYVFARYNYWIPLAPIWIITPLAYIFTAQLKIRTSEEYAAQFKKISETATKELLFFYKKSITDKLTGLYNFAYLKEKLEITAKQNKFFSIAILDIDHFKKYNDQNGHQAGNDALVKTANIFRKNIRRQDFLARYGGEEFVIIFADTTKEQAAILAENIRKEVENTPYEGGAKQPLGKVSVSIGIAEFPKDASVTDKLLEAADAALYKAKESGRNRVVVYSV